MRRSASVLALLAALAAAAPVALAQKTAAPSGKGEVAAGPSAPALAVAALPATLGGFGRDGEVVDFERRPNGAGYGASLRYTPRSGARAVATVFLYDRGARRAPEGGAGREVAEEMRVAVGEVGSLVRTGRYRSVSEGTEMELGAEAGRFRCATFEVIQGDGATTGDAVCLGVRQGAFLKVRVTAWTPPEPVAAGRMAAGIMRDVLRAP